MKIENYSDYFVLEDQKIRLVIIKLGKLENKFCLVLNKKKEYVGTITDGDIRRGLLANYSLDDKILKFCNKRSYFVKKKPTLKILNVLQFKKNIIFLPHLDMNNKVVALYNLSTERIVNEVENEMLIMAGGKGKRLRPFTKKLPKPLLPVKGKPIIERIILAARKQGIKNFIISINYLGSKIKKFLKNGEKLKVNIRYINENKPLGTAGALYFLKQTKLPFIVSNADIISNVDYNEMLKYHKKLKSYITIGAISNLERSNYGNIVFKNNRVKKIEEKIEKRTFFNAGIYVIDPNIDTFYKSKKFIHMTEFIEKAINKKKKVHIFPLHENWNDYGLKKKYLEQK